MKTLCVFLLFASPVWADPTVPQVVSCYQGLASYLGLKRMHFGKDRTTFAGGERAGVQGVYTFEGGKLTFYPLPTANTVEETNRNRAGMERFDGGRKLNYYLTLPSGGKPWEVVLTRSAFAPLAWAGEGAQVRYLGGGAQGRPTHLALTGSEVTLPDGAATSAFQRTLESILSSEPRELMHPAGEREALTAAITACHRTFPRGTSIGDSLHGARIREYTLGSHDKGWDH